PPAKKIPASRNIRYSRSIFAGIHSPLFSDFISFTLSAVYAGKLRDRATAALDTLAAASELKRNASWSSLPGDCEGEACGAGDLGELCVSVLPSTGLLQPR